MIIVLAHQNRLAPEIRILHKNGSTSDYIAAVAQVRETGGHIFTYQTDEPNPVHRARRDLQAICSTRSLQAAYAEDLV